MKAEESNGDRSSPASAAAASAEASPDAAADGSPLEIAGAEEDALFRDAPVLAREKVLRRRARRLRQLHGVYRRQLWAICEEIRRRQRDYVWEHGRLPFEQSPEEGGATAAAEGEGEGKRARCASPACKVKAMPFTKYCFSHILSDPAQVLYKRCSHVQKSTAPQSAQIPCSRPILRSAVPALCPVHLQKMQKSIVQGLKKSNINLPSTSNSVPRMSYIIAECVAHIQAKRRNLSKGIAERKSG